MRPPRPVRHHGIMSPAIRAVTRPELPAFVEAEFAAFGEPLSTGKRDAVCRLLQADRTLAAFDGDRIVGTAAAYQAELTVPGPAQLPAAAVTAVGVLPTHRRRGVLTSMMARQLDDVRARGEPLAVLVASESVIYGRFGYGVASFFAEVEIERVHARMAHPPAGGGRLVLLDAEAADKLLPACHDTYRRGQVGAINRPAAWWAMQLHDPDEARSGSGRRFHAIHERAPGEADGYLTYCIDHRVESSHRSVLQVEDLCATGDDVRAALWQFALNVDLIDTIRADCPVDEVLSWRLADPRQLRTVRLSDGLWVRLLDVPAALAGRTYSGRDRLVLQVHDAFQPALGGTFELDAGEDGSACRPVEAEPDLVLGASELGSVYLGGVRFGTLARAGRITERSPGALARADRMFAVGVAPWCDTDF